MSHPFYRWLTRLLQGEYFGLVCGKRSNVNRLKIDRPTAPRQVSSAQCGIVRPERKNAERQAS